MSLEEAQARHKTAGRNDSCPCGSGKKYKRCHQVEDDKVINVELKRLADEAQARADAEAENAKAENKGKPGGAGGKGREAQHSTKAKRSGKSATIKSSSEGAKLQSLPRRGAV